MSSNSMPAGALEGDGEATHGVRATSAAGRFYPASPERVAGIVGDLLAGIPVHTAAPERVLGILVPHAGLVFSGRVAARAYGLLEGKRDYDRVVLLGTSHRSQFEGVSVGIYDAFASPMGDAPVDVKCCGTLRRHSELFQGPRDVHADEHALEVQLPFLQSVFPDLPIVPLLCGVLNSQQLEEAAAVLLDHVDFEKTLWVISSDFTHHGDDFGYTPFVRDVAKCIRELDSGAMAYIEALDWRGLLGYVADTGATICGATGIALFLATLAASGVEATCEVLAHELSGEMLHDTEHSVSYVSAAFRQRTCVQESQHEKLVTQLSPENRGALICVARESIQQELYKGISRDGVSTTGKTERNGAENGPLRQRDDQDDELLSSQYACFVTLYVGDQMQGCMGDVEARGPLRIAVGEHACQAAFMDSRFQPLSATELTECRIEIAILSPPREIHDPREIRIGTHGISLRKGERRAVFLPDVLAAHDWSAQEALQRLALKAGLPAHGWRRAAISIFEAVTVSESLI